MALCPSRDEEVEWMTKWGSFTFGFSHKIYQLYMISDFHRVACEGDVRKKHVREKHVFKQE